MSEFKEQAQKTLDEIFNLIESNYEKFEVDFEDENLKIDSIDNKNVYIVSMHSPTSQIWLSSPISGAHHFQISSSEPLVWESTRDKNIKLIDLINKELSS